MKIKSLSRAEAGQSMQEWIKNRKVGTLDTEYQSFRSAFIERFEQLNSELRITEKNSLSRNKYIMDYKLGLFLYSYLDAQPWFNVRLAEDDGFWRYLSIKVVPDIVAKRWSFDNEDHYWKKSVRIWLKVMWWYVYLSWQGNEKYTEQVLSSKNMNTDVILNLVERVGGDGIYVNVYRYIMLGYSNLDDRMIKKYSENKSDKGSARSLFRTIMILHLSTCMVIEPGLYFGGEKEYVKRELFSKVLNQIGE